ncbi:MAG: AAA domain-containing protein [Elusimicrobiota bacterium]
MTQVKIPKHFNHLLDLIGIEREAERQENRKELERRPVEMREAAGKTVSRLNLIAEDTAVGDYPLIVLSKSVKEGAMSPFQAINTGDNVMVTMPNLQTADGTVYRVSETDITVALKRKTRHEMPAGLYRIDLLGSEATYYRMAEALRNLRGAKNSSVASLRDVILGKDKPGKSKPKSVEFFNRSLNRYQKQAAQMALGASKVAVIHGPPGTGKTTVLIEIIRQAVRDNQRVLACAPSNIAVDNILEQLVKYGVNTVRLGHPARVMEDLHHATLDALVAKHPSQRELLRLTTQKDKLTRNRAPKAEVSAAWKEIRNLEKSILKDVVGSASVVCATHGGFKSSLFKDPFDLVILDEASQATEPLSWVCLAKAKKAIFAGDVFQLPPTIYSPIAAKEGLAVTLLEQLKTILPEDNQALLRVQYRMNETIMRFSSEQFYKGKLIADKTVKEHLLSDLPSVQHSALTARPMVFVDTAGTGYDEGWDELLESRYNDGEAGLAAYFHEMLRGLGVSAKQVGLLTPYVAQVRRLRKRIEDRGLEIDTVDGFQGREKEAIILSLVRSNDRGEVGFLSDTRRMNVALTRARRLLIVIGDSATIGRHPFYCAFIDHAEKVGAHSSAYEWGSVGSTDSAPAR